MKYRNLFLLGIIFLASTFVLKTEAEVMSLEIIAKRSISSYRSYQDISIPKITVPTVVELPVSNLNFERYDFLVFDKTKKSFEPSLLVSNKVNSGLELTASVLDLRNNNTNYNSVNLVDSDEASFVELSIFNDQTGSARITISGNKDVTTDSLVLLLDNYVALPNTVSILAESNQGTKTVLATKRLDSQSVYFPKTTARKFIIDLTYSQPLRITEIRLNDLNNQVVVYNLRFLAQPNHDYSVYFNPDRRISLSMGEMTNLADNRDALKLSSAVSKENPSYVIADTDGDGIPDVRDNCVSISNIDQVDVNQNGRGDVCDDFDKDGIINSLDNCPNQPNMNQSDEDGDGIGDVCDGEESRITEKYKWLPWIGIIAATLVVIGLFTMTVLSMRKKEDLPPQI